MREEILKAAAIKSWPFFHKRYVDPVHDVAWHQREISEFYDEVARTTHHGVLLLPRDHLKSNTTFSKIVHNICKDKTRNRRTLVAQKTQKEASKTVSQILRALKTPRIQNDFNIRIARETGSFFTLVREDDLLKDPTVEGVGVLGSITGGHFDDIFLDDIVDIKNARTEGERQAVKEWFYSTLSFVVEPHTNIYYIGTRKHFAELVADLLANPIWRKLIRQAFLIEPTKVWYEETPDGNVVPHWEGDPVVLFPEKWSIEKLLLKKREVGSVYFNREMQNKPIANEDSPLKTQWLQFYRFAQEDVNEIDPLRKMKVMPGVWKQRVAFIDPAISTDDKADNFALISILIDHENNVYVEPYDQTCGHFDFPTQVKIISNYILTKQPWKTGIEANFYQRSLHQHMSRETLRPILPVVQSVNKEARIEAALSPMFEAGKIFLHHSMEELVEEYETFPKGRRDDRLDALAGVISLALGQPVTKQGTMRMALV